MEKGLVMQVPSVYVNQFGETKETMKQEWGVFNLDTNKYKELESWFKNGEVGRKVMHYRMNRDRMFKVNRL